MIRTGRGRSADSQRSRSKPGRGIFSARVRTNEPVCREHYRISLTVPAFPQSRPGQFVNILCCPCKQSFPRPVSISEDSPLITTGGDILSPAPLLRRPFSLAGRSQAGCQTELEILYRVVGSGTRWLSGVSIGEEINIIGPLGNGFTIGASRERALAVLIGGGTGIAPLGYLADELKKMGRDVIIFIGARSREFLPVSFLDAKRFPIIIATEDGSAGFRGMVHQGWEEWLGKECPDPSDIIVYTCGPEAMMKEVSRRCASMKVRCQVSLERLMACGMGLCQGCAVKVKSAEPPYWRFKLTCTDGPVFDADEVIWQDD